jgi:hypothetical protein
MFDQRPLPWPEVKVPRYKSELNGEWRVDTVDCPPLIRGYWRGLVPVKEREWLRLWKGDQLWMSSTPMELESQAHALSEMTGRVLIAGGGLGITLYNAIQKKEVEEVVLLEIDNGLVKWLRRQMMGREWSGLDKATLIWHDATVRMNLPYSDLTTEKDFDFLWVDIWERLGEEKALADVRCVQKAAQAKQVGWWGMELDFISFLQERNIKPPPTEEHWKMFEEFCGFPLMMAPEQPERSADAAFNAMMA